MCWVCVERVLDWRVPTLALGCNCEVKSIKSGHLSCMTSQPRGWLTGLVEQCR